MCACACECTAFLRSLNNSSVRYKDNVANTYEGISRVDLIAPFIRPKFLTEEVYTWATSILDSRSIWWGGVRHLVPMLDFVNCLETVNGHDTIRVHSTKFDRIPGSGGEGAPHALTLAGTSKYNEKDNIIQHIAL